MNVTKALTIFMVILFSSQALAWTSVRDFNFGSSGEIAINSEQGFNSIAGASKIVTQQDSHHPVLEGFSSAKLHVRKGEEGYGSWGGDFNFPEEVHKGEELWIQLYVYIPSDFKIDSNTGMLKFMRMRNIVVNGDEKSSAGHLDTLIYNEGSSRGIFAVLKEDTSNVVGIGDTRTQQIPRDQWVKIEQYIYLDDVCTRENEVYPCGTGGKSMVRVWMNDELIGEVDNVQTITDATSYYSRMLLFTYWNGFAPKTQDLYIDHLVMTNERPRNRDKNGNNFLGNLLNRPILQDVTVVE